jgi:outer membrane protein OmpA-like peptidoglycan-associated protein
MPSVSKWVVASVATAVVFTGIAGFLAFPPISADVRDRAATRLAEEGRSWAKLAADGRDLTLTGIAPEPGDPRLAAEAADRVFGVRTVTEKAAVLPLADPWVWSAVLTADAVTIAGTVPSEAVRTSLAAAVGKAVKGRRLVDSATLARGAPRDFAPSAEKAVATLAELVEGSVAHTPKGWTIEGRLADRAAWKALVARLKTPDLGFVVADAKLVEPVPVPFDLKIDVAAGRLAATGFVPDAAGRETLGLAAKASGRVLDDRSEVAPGAPAGFAAAVAMAADLTGSLADGSVAIGPNGFAIAGHPLDRAAWKTAKQRLAAGLPGAPMAIEDHLIEPSPDPYDLRLTIAAGRLSVAGFVPDGAGRDALARAAKAAFLGFDGATEQAPGAPAGFAEAIGFAADLVAGLKEGRIALGPDGLSIAGRPVDRAAWRRATEKLAAGVPGGMRLAEVALVEPLPDPYRLTLAAEAGRVTVDGFLPDVGTRDGLAAVIGPRAGPLDVSGVEIAGGAPEGLAAAVAAVRPLFARATSPQADFLGRRLTIGGKVATREIGAQIAAAVRAALPTGWDLFDGGLAPLPPPEQVPADACRDGLRAAQANEKVRFAVGSATLDPESLAIVDALALAAQRCLAARITIAGHTDATGDADANLVLSEKRAAAVAEQLIADGVAPERLTAVGFGATRPIADDGSEEGRRVNRRIDFVVEGEVTP